MVLPNLRPGVNSCPSDVTMRQRTLHDVCGRRAPKRQHPSYEDCVREIACFYRFGDYALELLPRVLENIWRHYGVESQEERDRILRAAAACGGRVLVK